ncbi:MAG: Ig-like domain-containing protein [Clostridia bacterium]|nr:Ig-like domain-containing protein [Clostridia bacterium]
MFKKTTSILLSLMMLLAATGVSATPITKPSGMIVCEDNFDATAAGDYNLNNGDSALPGDVFSAPNTTIASGYGQIIADPNNINNHMFQAYPTSDADYGQTYANRSLYTKALDLGSSANSGTWYAFSYDFKMSQTNANFYIAHDLFQLRNDGWICTTNDSYVATPIRQYEADKCYHIDMIAHDDTMWGWLCDDDGNVLATSATRTYSSVTSGTASITTSSENKLCAYSINASSSNNRGGLITLDNAKLSEFNPETAGPMFVTTPYLSDSMAVPTETRTVSVVSDQIIDLDNSDSVKITKVDSGTRTCSIESTTNPYTYKVTLPDALEEGSTYILNLSGLKNSSGTDAGDSAKFTFATSAPSAAPDVVSSIPASGADNVPVETKTLTVNFNKAMNDVPETVTLVAGGTASNITATVSPRESSTTYTFTWTDTLKGNTVYTVSLSEFADDEGVAPITSSISFTTIYNGIVKIEDGFESGAQASGYGYNTEADKSTYPLTTGGNHTEGMIANVDGGYTNKALEMKTGGSGTGACLETLKTVNTFTPETKNVNGETVYEQLVLTYRINLKEIAARNENEMIVNNLAAGKDNGEYPNGGANLRFAAAKELSYHTNIARIVSDEEGNPYIGIHGAEPAELAALETDHWYNIIWSVDGTQQTFAVVDSTTGKLVWSTEKDLSNYYNAGDAITVYALSAGRTLLNDELCNDSQTVLLDDFTLWKIKPWEEEHTLSIIGDVSQANNTFSMNFNQPVIGTADMLRVDVNAGGNYKPVAFDADFIYPDFCKMTVTPKDLAADSSYVLDYSGIRALSGSTISEAAACTGTFTTTSDAEYKVSFVDAVDDSAGNAISFEIYNSTADITKVYVAYYAENELIGFNVPTDEVLIDAGTIASVSVPTVEGYDAFKVFVWDDGLKPLMRVYSHTMDVAE